MIKQKSRYRLEAMGAIVITMKPSWIRIAAFSMGIATSCFSYANQKKESNMSASDKFFEVIHSLVNSNSSNGDQIQRILGDSSPEELAIHPESPFATATLEPYSEEKQPNFPGGLLTLTLLTDIKNGGVDINPEAVEKQFRSHGEPARSEGGGKMEYLYDRPGCKIIFHFLLGKHFSLSTVIIGYRRSRSH
jgi:hypothetical protein